MRVALVAALAAVALLVPGQAGSKTFPTRVQVTAKEFYFLLAPGRTVKSGKAVVQFVNYGQDPHDLLVQRNGTTKVYRVPTVQPGDHFDLSLTLTPGKYTLWCGIANHAALGMKTTLIVK
jgi:plastocyanin